MTNTELLTGRIDDSGLKLEYIASRMNMSRATLWRKITNQSEFKQSEIDMLSTLLKFRQSEVRAVFFAKNVCKMPTNTEVF